MSMPDCDPVPECVSVPCCAEEEDYSSPEIDTDGNETGAPCPSVAVDIEPPSGRTVTIPTAIFLTPSVAGAKVYYTLDGTTPTSASTLYTAPFNLTDINKVISAIAVPTGCPVGPVAIAQYHLADDVFQFSYSCVTTDKVGRWGEFAPNGAPDYHWNVRLGRSISTVVKRIEIYQTTATGLWNSGQAWATDEFVNPKEGPPNFHIFPLKVFDDGLSPNVAFSTANALNSAYAATFGTFGPATMLWTMCGQPAFALFGYFKLIIFLGDGKVLESIINTTCGDPPPECPPLHAPTLVPTCEGIDIVMAFTPGTTYEIYRRTGVGPFSLLTSGTITTNPQTVHDNTVLAGITYCYFLHIVDVDCDRVSPFACAQMLCLPFVTISTFPPEIELGDDVAITISSSCTDTVKVWDCEGDCEFCGVIDDPISLDPDYLFGPASLDSGTVGNQISQWSDRMSTENLSYVSNDTGVHAPVIAEDGDGRYLQFRQANQGTLRFTDALAPDAFTILTVLNYQSGDFILGAVTAVDGLKNDNWRVEIIGSTDLVVICFIDGVEQSVTFAGLITAGQVALLALIVDPAFGVIARLNGAVSSRRWTTAGVEITVRTDYPTGLSLAAFRTFQTGDSEFDSSSESSNLDFRDLEIWKEALSSPVLKLAEDVYADIYGITPTDQSALLFVHRIDDWNPSVPFAGPYGQSTTITIENVSNETLSWQGKFTNTLTDPDPQGEYVTITPSSGILYPGQKASVVAAINEAIQFDASTGTISFTNLTNGQGNASITVTPSLTV